MLSRSIVKWHTSEVEKQHRMICSSPVEIEIFVDFEVPHKTISVSFASSALITYISYPTGWFFYVKGTHIKTSIKVTCNLLSRDVLVILPFAREQVFLEFRPLQVSHLLPVANIFFFALFLYLCIHDVICK